MASADHPEPADGSATVSSEGAASGVGSLLLQMSDQLVHAEVSAEASAAVAAAAGDHLDSGERAADEDGDRFGAAGGLDVRRLPLPQVCTTLLRLCFGCCRRLCCG